MKKSYVYLPAVASAKAGTPNSQILYQRDHTKASGSDEFFYVHDRLGSVRLVVDESETTKNSYTYDPTGVDFATEVTESAENPFKFTGQWYDDEISQYYLRARMYDPELMRFTAYDPFRGKHFRPLTLHRYLYCVNNSINKVDLTGKYAHAWPVFGAVTAGTAVRGVATLVLARGLNLENDTLINAGLYMHHFIAPAMYVGAAMGPMLPAAGGLGVKALAATWHGLSGGAIAAGNVAYGTGAFLAKEISLFAMTHPGALMYATDNFLDACATLADSPFPPHTPAGGAALILKELIGNYDY